MRTKKTSNSLEPALHHYLDDFIANNHAAKVVADGLRVIGPGFWPVIDHITFRTHDVDSRAKEFLAHGYAYDKKLGVIEYENWWAKVYRKIGYPVIFIDQAYEGKRGKGSLIPDWVNTFGDKVLHHVAIRVEDIEKAIYYLEKQGVPFAGKIVGDKGTDLRQIFTAPEMKNGKAFSVLELAERHHGYAGFLPPQADGLMESTRVSY
ncbi:MAG: hypothetical protein HYZ83_05980 [Candidatus Omnitrophica bacterium]|nr:hypothetical protein [Candidatus Omnitrophota bacterium]